MAKLVCRAGPSAGHEYPLTKDVTTMGRSSSSDVQIKDHMASRNHCQVRREGKLYTLVDLGSRNGTKLNDKKVSERQLAYGDVIKVGECEWLLVKESGDVELKDLLSKYDLQEKIGEGGMGVVYKAVQKSMARTIALKILSPKYAARPKFVDQFIKEARAAGALNHPNIIQVHDVATENDIHYFSMEYVDGPTCMQLLKANGAFPVPEALEIARQVAKGLEYAHEHRLIHQDIKPDNIMVGSNNLVKVADLGISKTFDEAEHEDGPKRVMGTPHYMAPEAALGKKIDHRVDLYSLGATLYHLLTGKTPYTGTSATEVLKSQVMDPLPAIHDLNPNVPEGVCALVERLAAKKPEDRYQSATEVIEEIKRLQAGLDLGKDRIAGSETMILQRLAKGERTPAAGVSTPDHGGSTASIETGQQALEARRLRQVFILGVAAVILFLIILLLPRFLPKGGTGPDDEPETGTETIPTAVSTTAAPDPSVELSRRLNAVEAALRDGAAANFDQLRGEVEQILGVVPNGPLRTRADGLHGRILSAIAANERDVRERAWKTLNSEVQSLAGEKNFDLALRRIDGFAHKDHPDYQQRLQALRQGLVSDRDRYLGSLNDRITSYVGRKDIAGLRTLRDQLPPALLGGAIEKRIADEVAKLDREAQQRHQTALRELADELLRLDPTKVEERHRLVTLSMGDGPAKAQADQFLAAAQNIPVLIQALDTAIRGTEARKVRFQGELQRMQQPDLVGASRAGLLVAPPVGGGEIEVAWRTIDQATLAAVTTQVLGSTDAHKDLFAALAEAKRLSGQ